jgi:hypothetical protein
LPGLLGLADRYHQQTAQVTIGYKLRLEHRNEVKKSFFVGMHTNRKSFLEMENSG